MTTTNFNVRMDVALKDQATQVFADYGLSPTQAIKLFFNQVVSTHKVPLSFDYKENFMLTPQAEARLRQSMQDIKNGDYTVAHGADGLAKALAEITDA